jgi:hypothetical protein
MDFSTINAQISLQQQDARRAIREREYERCTSAGPGVKNNPLSGPYAGTLPRRRTPTIGPSWRT